LRAARVPLFAECMRSPFAGCSGLPNNYTRMKSFTIHTNIITHAVESRSSISLTHHVHASRLRSTFIIKHARHTKHAQYTRVSKAPHTTRIFEHTPTNHAHASRSRIALRSTFMIKLARHTHKARTSHAHQKLHTQHAYSHTRRRITLTHHAHVSRSRISIKYRAYAPLS
jgi:hypothetical protein